jgi:glutaredoxin 3
VLAQPARKSEMMKRANGRHTVPQIFVGKTHVGGCDDLYALEQAGKLDALLKG